MEMRSDQEWENIAVMFLNVDIEMMFDSRMKIMDIPNNVFYILDILEA